MTIIMTINDNKIIFHFPWQYQRCSGGLGEAQGSSGLLRASQNTRVSAPPTWTETEWPVTCQQHGEEWNLPTAENLARCSTSGTPHFFSYIRWTIIMSSQMTDHCKNIFSFIHDDLCLHSYSHGFFSIQQLPGSNHMHNLKWLWSFYLMSE